MATPRWLLPVAVAVALTAGACGSGDESDEVATSDGGSPGTATTDAGSPGTATSPPAQQPTYPAAVAGIVDAAVADAAERAGVEPEAVAVTSVTEVEWPSGALGCPQPGLGYSLAFEDGLQILLTVDGELFDYRSGRAGEPVWCPPEGDDGGIVTTDPDVVDDIDRTDITPSDDGKGDTPTEGINPPDE